MVMDTWMLGAASILVFMLGWVSSELYHQTKNRRRNRWQ